MFFSRPIIAILSLLFLFILSGTAVFADPVPHSCMVLITGTTGGSVQPEGAVSVPEGSEITLIFTPSEGYEINRIFIDGADTGKNSTLTLSPVIHDMTVHAVFAPESRSRSPGLPASDLSEPAPSSLREDQTMVLPASVPSYEKSITVGYPGADYERIQDAIAAATPGETIFIGAGTYQERISIDKPVSLVGLYGASGIPVISSVENGTIVTLSADNILLKNLSITGSGEKQDSAALEGYGITALALENCVISNTRTGIGISGSGNITIRDCTLRNTSYSGLLFSSVNQLLITGNTLDLCNTGVLGTGLTGLAFRDNLVSSSNQQGALFRDGITDSDISANFFVGNNREKNASMERIEHSSLYLEDADNVTLSDNTLTGNHGSALTLDGGDRMIVTGNWMEDNDAGFTYFGSSLHPGNRIDASNMVDGLPVIYYEQASGETIDGITPATLYLQNCTSMTIRNVTMKSRNGFGIQVTGGSGITISGCQVGESLYSTIHFAGVNRGQVTGSEIFNGSESGIGLVNTDQVTVSDCLIRDTRTGISSDGSIGGIISGNNITDVIDGMVLTGSAGMIVKDNKVEARDAGIRLSGLSREDNPGITTESSENQVTMNTFTSGTPLVLINDTRVYGNSFFLNDFITTPVVSPRSEGGEHAGPGMFSMKGIRVSSPSGNTPGEGMTDIPAGINSWDTGDRVRYSYNGSSFSGYLGNYWSNYTGNETGTSGVGDLPVQITAGNLDTNPLFRERKQYHVLGSGYYLEMSPGWNFVSIPSALRAGSDTAMIFSDVDTAGHTLYTWDNSTWFPVKRDDRVLPLHGYWVYSRSNAAVPLSFDPGTIPPPFHLSTGWNAIGYPGIQPAAARDALSSLGDSWESATGYNASSQAEDDPVMREDGKDAIMYPSRGYWLYMNLEWDLQPVTG